MQHETNSWYAVYTRPRWEKKVASALERRQIESYCPLNQVTRQWSDRRKIVEEPLFCYYVFVRVPDSKKQLVRETEGIINFVYWLGKPAMIPDHEIELIQRFLRDYKDVSLEKFPLRHNALVEVTAGPLMNHRGRIVELGKNRVKAVLSSLGYNMVANVAADEVMMVPAI